MIVKVLETSFLQVVGQSGPRLVSPGEIVQLPPDTALSPFLELIDAQGEVIYRAGQRSRYQDYVYR